MKRPREQIGKVSAGKVAVASAASPVNLGVLGSSTVGTLGLVVAGHPILGAAVAGIGALAYGALIGLDLFNDKFISKVYGLSAPDAEIVPGKLELDIEPEAIEPDDIRGLYLAILANHEEIRTTVAAGGDILQRSLRETLERSAELVREAGQVALRSNALSRYVRREQAHVMQSEADKLEAQARATRDKKAAETFMQAAEAKRQQLATYVQIDGLCDRVKAQLSVIETSLDSMQAKLIKLNATDIEEAVTVGASLSRNLDTLTSDIQVLESTVDETIREFAL